MKGSEVTAIRLKPVREVVWLGRYTLDAVTLEVDPSGALWDVRFEVGEGYDIYWAVPLEPCGRMRLIHVDNAVYEIDEVVVELDPFEVDLEPMTWRGDLARIGPGGSRTLVRVTAEATEMPPAYRCVAEVRNDDGSMTVYALSYSTST